MEITLKITAEPALMALLENLGKTILIASTDLREAAEVKMDGKQIAQIIPVTPAPAPIATTIPVTPAPAPIATAISAPFIPAASVTAPTTSPAPVVPTAPAHTYTLSELGVAGADIAQSGKRDQLITLLRNFGVQALTQLAPERYPEFAQGLRALGAKI